MKLRILFNTFREFSVWKTRAVYAMRQLKTKYVLCVLWLQSMGIFQLSTEYTGHLKSYGWVVWNFWKR